MSVPEKGADPLLAPADASPRGMPDAAGARGPAPRRAGGAPRYSPRILAGALFALAVVAVAAVAAWPVYRSESFLLLVAVGALVGGGIAVASWLRRWNGWIVAGALAAAVLVLGVPLAVPSRLGPPDELLRGLGELASGLVFGWKDLVTVELPVGSYRNLLVPALVVFLVGTCVVLLLAWRDDSGAYAAVPVALGMVTFGLFFGRTTVSAPLAVGPVFLYAPLETAIGLAGLLACLLWLAWRTHDERTRALHRAAASSGVRFSRRPTRADRRRTALGAGMVVGALVLAVAVVPYAARGADREVLRSAVGPDIDLSAEVSPLSEYRALFSDGRAGEVLFTVEAVSGSLPERVRIATLDAYDGEVFRSGGEGAVDAGRFVRVPSALDAGDGTPVEARIEIQGWDEIWMPTAGRLEAVEFEGERPTSLADRFYYNAAASAGVQTAGGGLEPGDAYVVRGVEPESVELSQLEAPGGPAGVTAPDSLRTWMDEHATGSGGAALAGLVSLLRERGYLSHGLTVGDDEPDWVRALPDYSFQPSASGHSLARVDTMFARLLERETDPRAAASGDYVAAIGDDEQFAVAVALMARELGFPSRVVLGARLSSADPGLATCDEGACRAQDLTAWTEVQSSDGRWIAVDATPQYAQSPSLDVTEQRDPENVTEVRPESVEEVVPPEPSQEDSADDGAPEEESGPDLAWLWPLLRIGGISLLVLALALGPFLIVLSTKAARRRSRRRVGAPAARIAGGWEELVDAALDTGRTAPRTLTRTELADAFGTPGAPALARDADRAVFSAASLSDDDARRYWQAVDDERRALRRERGFWRGVLATVSLRSLFRPLAPASGVRTRFAERGRRRAEPVRPMP
ncbi:transglutaminase-like domain-containing protein [Microbacterium sp. M3]|uniref:Transglutaminase-like domain-containing protein n=1 Tax=Microbacterium arthrosphaerae TaxID=792652 RepID=A0ABU4H3E6_9MICO|nr:MULTISPECIES: transglutaminase-like domain-containing protein [Microbacterium]MDW4573858.1 transglutaminase-like domain-containing protein [Microbacterium arthrosphaerae]MDW7607713.1 transglutaminase-like domain-containing protein [Microbacterium sp. M3]